MEGTYDVMLGSRKMGTVNVTRQGLYLQFDCRCVISGEVMYDLAVDTGDAKMKLGLLTPDADHFSLRTKLPGKRLGQGSLTFKLQPRHAEMKDNFISIKPDEPFDYLQRLECAYLATRNHQIGIGFRE